MTVYRSQRARREVLTLLDRTWPGAGARFQHAADLGWSWADHSTPFLAIDRQAPVAHAGVLRVPLRVQGEAHRVNAIHGVCTHPDHRRRGHGHRVLSEALAFCDAQGETTFLNTSIPGYYEPFGFRAIVEQRWRVAPAGEHRPGRPLSWQDEADVALLHALLPERAPLSDALTGVDPGWLFAIDAMLERAVLTTVPDTDAIVVYGVEGTTVQVFDCVARDLPPLDRLLAALPPARRVALCFSPDRFAPRLSTPVAGAYDDGSVLMVRGPWPAEHGVMLPILYRC